MDEDEKEWLTIWCVVLCSWVYGYGGDEFYFDSYH